MTERIYNPEELYTTSCKDHEALGKLKKAILKYRRGTIPKHGFPVFICTGDWDTANCFTNTYLKIGLGYDEMSRPNTTSLVTTVSKVNRKRRKLPAKQSGLEAKDAIDTGILIISADLHPDSSQVRDWTTMKTLRELGVLIIVEAGYGKIDKMNLEVLGKDFIEVPFQNKFYGFGDYRTQEAFEAFLKDN